MSCCHGAQKWEGNSEVIPSRMLGCMLPKVFLRDSHRSHFQCSLGTESEWILNDLLYELE